MLVGPYPRANAFALWPSLDRKGRAWIERGFVLSQAITQGTDNVVVCRLRFQLGHLAPDEDPGDVPGSPSATTSGPALR